MGYLSNKDIISDVPEGEEEWDKRSPWQNV